MALVERIQQTGKATYWPGKIPMNYVYTAGRAGEVFFQNIKKGKFSATSCEKCGIVYMPGRIFCERCFERIEKNWIDVENFGVVDTFTVCYETYDEQEKEEPSVVAFIRFEGTDGGLFHWLGEVDPEEVYIGMPVKAVFRSEGDRNGSILDIQHFVPIE